MPSLNPKQWQLSAKKLAINMIIYALVFILISSVVNWWRQPVSPKLTFTSIDNQSLDLANFSQSQPVLVYFWGSWCGICHQTSPAIHQLSQDKTYPVVTVAVSSGDKTAIKDYLAKHQWQFVTVNDNEGKIFADWQGQVTPSFVMLKNGRMVQGLTGYHRAWELKLRLWLLDKLDKL